VTAHVQEDINEAVRIGVRGVPTVFINGKRLRDRSYDAMAAAVAKELRKQPAPK
jgi:protein-disulfide isomerase